MTLVIGRDYRDNLEPLLKSKSDYAKKHGYTYIQGGTKKPNGHFGQLPFLK